MPLTNNTRFCGARSKQNNHRPCMQPAMKTNGRCRLHGGKSTGPKTPEGKHRSAQANLKNGFYTKDAIFERLRIRMMLQWRKELNDN